MRTDPFVGSEAVASGLVRKHELRTRFTLVFPDVYLAEGIELTFGRRARAAWLWSHREGVLAGRTAAALHGDKWVDATAPIEIMWRNARPPHGIRTGDSMLRRDERTVLGDMQITTVARTAFDIGRRGRLNDAITRLDALGNATKFSAQDVLDVAARRPGARGIRLLRRALVWYDAGAASPRETWLRLLLIGADFPRPETQIPVLRTDGWSKYYLDMGWRALKLAVEYDGDQHRTDSMRYAHDIRRAEELADLGWKVIRITKADRESDIVRRVERAYSARLR